MRVSIDSAGRLVIPKPIRESAGLEPGMELEIEYRDGKVQIEPAPKQVKWAKRGSFTVATAPEGVNPLTNQEVQAILRRVRDRRA